MYHFKLEVVMLIALFLIGFLISVNAKNKLNRNTDVSNRELGTSKDSDAEELPFNPDYNLRHFIDSMADKLRCSIAVKECSISTTMNARPVLLSLFSKRSKRKYIIRINNRSDFKGAKLHEVPLDAKVGLWYHELMHIKDYQSRSFWGILKRGIQYLSIKGKRVFENEIDRMVINDGYGKYLYQWSHYSMNASNISEKYKAFKSAIYLTPQQISQELLLNHLSPAMNVVY